MEKDGLETALDRRAEIRAAAATAPNAHRRELKDSLSIQCTDRQLRLARQDHLHH